MNIKEFVKQQLYLEADSILKAAEKINENFEKAVELILNCSGKVVAIGMGKSGIIARKISATLASTGTTSIFLHPAEGIHGDLGMQKLSSWTAYSQTSSSRMPSMTGGTAARTGASSLWSVVVESTFRSARAAD
nr:hypothetical protein [Candidatus Cloacimonadota bacterium]